VAKRLTILIPIVGLAIAGCGGGGEGAHTASTQQVNASLQSTATTRSNRAQPGRDLDGDADGPAKGRFDKDDHEILLYGHPGTRADVRAAAATLEHYYKAVAARDGAAACADIYALFAEAIVENYGRGSTQHVSSGTTCAAVLSTLLEREGGKLARETATLKVTGIRIMGNRGFALFGFRGLPYRNILMHRESGTWKVEDLTDAGLV